MSTDGKVKQDAAVKQSAGGIACFRRLRKFILVRGRPQTKSIAIEIYLNDHGQTLSMIKTLHLIGGVVGRNENGSTAVAQAVRLMVHQLFSDHEAATLITNLRGGC